MSHNNKINLKCQDVPFLSPKEMHSFNTFFEARRIFSGYIIIPRNAVFLQTLNLKMSTEGPASCDSPWWICPIRTGRCCVWRWRPPAPCDSAPPGSPSRARRSCHPGSRGQKEVTVKNGSTQCNYIILHTIDNTRELEGDT